MGLALSGPLQAALKSASGRFVVHPQSLTYVSSWGFSPLLPLCNSKYLEYKYPKMKGGGEKTLAGSFVNPTADLERNVLMFAQFCTAVRLQFFQ